MSWAWTVFISIVGIFLGSAVISTALSNRQATRLRKQELFAKAYQVALRRVEMLYRILRRTGDLDEDVKLRDVMHETQEETSYYIGLLSMESVELGKAYSALIDRIKAETADSFRLAWKNAPGKPSVELKNFNHPVFDQEERTFLGAARNHFRPFSSIRNYFAAVAEDKE
jgi:hypothetical protein